MVLFNLQVGTYTRLVYKGSPPGIIINRDLTNSALLGPFSGFGPSAADLLDALTFVQYSGDNDVYGSALGGPITVDVMSDMVNWSPSPAQSAASLIAQGIATSANQASQLTAMASQLSATNNPGYGPSTLAAQNNQLSAINNPSYGPSTLVAQNNQNTAIPNNIATTGVPLLTLPTLIQNTSTPSIAAGSSVTYPVGGGTFNINQPGYEIILQLEAVSATAATQAGIVVNWLDSAGNQIGQDYWWVYVGTSGNPHTIYGYGPTDGAQFTISIGAYNNAIKVTLLKLYLNSKIYNRSDWRTERMPALANGGGNLSLIEPQGLIVGRRAPAVIAPGATDVTYLGLFTGKVWVFALTSSAVNDMTLKIQNGADQQGQDFFFSVKSDGAGQINTYANFPRSQGIVSFINGNAGSQTMRYLMVASEY